MLKLQDLQLRIVFHISKTDSGLSATMYSPDQGAKGIPVSATQFVNPTLMMEVRSAGIKYEGELKETTIIGKFTQGGLSFPLNLSRDSIVKEVMRKLQDPVKPYPYYEEELTFENEKAAIRLAGTLTLPKKKGSYPAVILISGSGPQNRDEELLGHKPFLVIADYLTRNGFAVLRFDDRGVGASTGEFNKTTSADFSEDVESAIRYLKNRKEINSRKIGLIGHSEGGLIAPMVAAHSKDVAFLVLLAGPGLRGKELLLLQQELIVKASGMNATNIQKLKEVNSKAFDLVLNATDTSALRISLNEYLTKALQEQNIVLPSGMTIDAYASAAVDQMLNPWMLYFIRYDPVPALAKVTCPVLALNGSKDLQVASKENLNAIRIALEKGANKKATIKEYPDLNHLFQHARSGLPLEYATIQETFSPEVLNDLVKWMTNITK